MYLFKSFDHPEANGRQPRVNDTKYPIRFKLDGGEMLTVEVGEAGFQTLCVMFDMMRADDRVALAGSIKP